MYTRELEMVWLIDKIRNAKSVLESAEAYYEERHQQWAPGVAASFMDMLEKKRDMLEYEEHRAEKLGWLIASGRDTLKLDI
jgi:hypothetical protein